MPENNNTDVTKELRDGLKINQSFEKVPTRVAESIVPAFICNPKPKIKIAHGTTSDSTGSTIHTSHKTKKTFIVGLHLSLSKDALSNSTFTRMTMTPKSQSGQTAMYIRLEPTTAAQGIQQDMMFPIPIEVEKNSTITISNGSATASIDMAAVVYYYEMEN